MTAQLYTFWRSSAAYRVRIALHLKGLDFTSVPVNLAKGAQAEQAYKKHNPQGRIPYWQEADFGLAQSLAIIEYLDETQPAPALLPGDARQRAAIRSFALTIACDIHPLNNLATLNYLRTTLDQSQEALDRWYRYWIVSGLAALEAQVQGPFIFGDTPTLADICLVPQLYNARRFSADMSAYPKLVAADVHACKHPAFMAAVPEVQPDAA
jgi:maleylacetoacetate isomerase